MFHYVWGPLGPPKLVGAGGTWRAAEHGPEAHPGPARPVLPWSWVPRPRCTCFVLTPWAPQAWAGTVMGISGGPGSNPWDLW